MMMSRRRFIVDLHPSISLLIVFVVLLLPFVFAQQEYPCADFTWSRGSGGSTQWADNNNWAGWNTYQGSRYYISRCNNYPNSASANVEITSTSFCNNININGPESFAVRTLISRSSSTSCRPTLVINGVLSAAVSINITSTTPVVLGNNARIVSNGDMQVIPFSSGSLNSGGFVLNNVQRAAITAATYLTAQMTITNVQLLEVTSPIVTILGTSNFGGSTGLSFLTATQLTTTGYGTSGTITIATGLPISFSSTASSTWTNSAPNLIFNVGAGRNMTLPVDFADTGKVTVQSGTLVGAKYFSSITLVLGASSNLILGAGSSSNLQNVQGPGIVYNLGSLRFNNGLTLTSSAQILTSGASPSVTWASGAITLTGTSKLVTNDGAQFRIMIGSDAAITGTGTLEWANGNVIMSGGGRVYVYGSPIVSGASLTISSSGILWFANSISFSYISMNGGGSLYCAGSLSLINLQWFAGSFSSPTLSLGTNVAVLGQGPHTIRNSTATILQGTNIAWTSGSWDLVTTVLTNLGTINGTFSGASVPSLLADGVSSWINRGVISITGSGLFMISGLRNTGSGTFSISSPVLSRFVSPSPSYLEAGGSFSCGMIEVASAGSLTLASEPIMMATSAYINVAGGDLSITRQSLGARVVVSSGSLFGESGLTLPRLDWSGGSVSSSDAGLTVGTFLALSGGSLTLNGRLTVTNSSRMAGSTQLSINTDNGGMLTTTASCTSSYVGPVTLVGPVTNNGNASITAPSDPSAEVGLGSFVNNGYMAITGEGVLSFDSFANSVAGQLVGSGSIFFNKENTTMDNYGIMAPGIQGQSTKKRAGLAYSGSLAIIGNIQFHPSSVVQIVINGNTPIVDYPQIVVQGAAHLDGTLSFSFRSNYIPQSAAVFIPMNYTRRSGTFYTVSPATYISASNNTVPYLALMEYSPNYASFTSQTCDKLQDCYSCTVAQCSWCGGSNVCVDSSQRSCPPSNSTSSSSGGGGSDVVPLSQCFNCSTLVGCKACVSDPQCSFCGETSSCVYRTSDSACVSVVRSSATCAIITPNNPSNQNVPGGPPASSDSAGLIAGIVVAIVALVAIVVLFIVLFIRRRRAGRKSKPVPLTEVEMEKIAFHGAVRSRRLTRQDQSRVGQLGVLEGLLTDDNMAIPVALFNITPYNEIDRTAQSLVYIFEGNRHAIPLIFRMIDIEVAGTTQSGTLFRLNSAASKMLTAYSSMIGLKYVFDTLSVEMHDLLVGTAGGEITAEVDPTKVNPNDDNVDLSVNKYELMLHAQKILSAILRSLDKVPPPMRQICQHLRDEVEPRFPDAVHTCVGGFFFLRFWNVIILSPENYGLAKSPPSQASRRVLVLITKILQNLANNVVFGEKEQFMVQLNDFIQTNQARLNDFFEQLSSPPVLKKQRKSTRFSMRGSVSLGSGSPSPPASPSSRSSGGFLPGVSLTSQGSSDMMLGGSPSSYSSGSNLIKSMSSSLSGGSQFFKTPSAVFMKRTSNSPHDQMVGDVPPTIYYVSLAYIHREIVNRRNDLTAHLSQELQTNLDAALKEIGAPLEEEADE
eukprot:TRINITY_DN1072_c0_g1_i1.p1 TRINITY_DN1072_c0_g1~~TRINITY_DN1072_c0_g1_i1.p1  ORF type:complete len:1548 (-),score=341.18 TRINITY_DN1072_c0_g1_i1:187-4830(-)